MPDPETDPELQRALRAVRLAVFDVDGTLTDGGVVYGGGAATGEGEAPVVESQRFCVKDGQGLVLLVRAGVELAWISGRGCAATERRARDLGVAHLFLRRGPKGDLLRTLQAELGVGPEATLAMGDDLPDLALFELAAVRACPSDAVPEIAERANLRCSRPAGHGAAREVCEQLLRARGEWTAVVEGMTP